MIVNLIYTISLKKTSRVVRLGNIAEPELHHFCKAGAVMGCGSGSGFDTFGPNAINETEILKCFLKFLIHIQCCGYRSPLLRPDLDLGPKKWSNTNFFDVCNCHSYGISVAFWLMNVLKTVTFLEYIFPQKIG
jgi:hypothetical protein